MADARLPNRALGATGVSVSVVSLGGVGIGAVAPDELYGGVTDEQAIAAVHRAIARGMNLIDTSPLYKESERRIGLALEALSVEDRRHVHVGTKIGDDCPPYSVDYDGHSPFSYERVMRSVRHSLAKLRVVEKLAYVLVHDPTMDELDVFFTPDTGGAAALARLQADGLVGAVGIGCVEHEQHLAFISRAKGAGVLLSVNDYNLTRRYAADATWPAARANGYGVLNAGALYMGLLADPHASWQHGCAPGRAAFV